MFSAVSFFVPTGSFMIIGAGTIVSENKVEKTQMIVIIGGVILYSLFLAMID